MAVATAVRSRPGRAPEVLVVSIAACGLVVVIVGHTHAAPGHHATGAAPIVLGALMGVFMMMPLSARSISVVRERSLPGRRTRAMVEHVVGFGAVWAVIGAVISVAVVTLRTRVPMPAAFVILVAIAVSWQLSGARDRRARRCGRLRTSPPSGWRAEAGTLGSGSLLAVGCVGTCWAAMAAMAAAPGPVVMGAMVAAYLGEWVPGPNLAGAARRVGPAIAYVAIAVAVVVVDLVMPAAS